MHSLTLQFCKKVQSSEILVAEKLLQTNAIKERIQGLSSQAVLVYDDNISIEHIDALKACLFIPISVAEHVKSRATKELIENILLENKIGKNACLIALGGGALSDLVGFVASTYLRGIRFVTIPTTLLSMVDASIGGKTGVNVKNFKNYVGTFYPSELIAIDTDFLHTLPEKELISGIAEVIKYGLIKCPGLIELLQGRHHLFQKKDPVFFQQIIQRSIQIKKEVVENDPEENGMRRILNFGHTIGHAIESLSNFQLSHGEAIACGMCVESYISYLRGNLSQDDIQLIFDLFNQYGFSLSGLSSIESEDLWQAMLMDKKSLADRVRIVLLKGLGSTDSCSADYVSSISYQEFLEALHWFGSKREENIASSQH